MHSNRYSELKIFGFPDKVEAFRLGLVTAPIYVRIKPINVCNDHCWWCAYHAPDLSQMHTEMAKRDVIPMPKLEEILDDLRDMGVRAVTYSGGGEPLLHRAAAEYLWATRRAGLDLSIITNGQFLTGERARALAGAKWVRVSMDYADGAQLAEFRGGRPEWFEERMTNLQTFAQMKSPLCELEVNYIVHAKNWMGLVTIARRLRDAGVQNVRFSPMWVAPGFESYHSQLVQPDGKPRIPLYMAVRDQLAEIVSTLCGPCFTVNSTYDINHPAHGVERGCTRCLFMQTVPVIGADLNVYACHNKAYDAKGLIGSIREQRFKSLWFSETAAQAFANLNPSRDCRHQCANHTKVHLYNGLADGSMDNFV